MATKILKKCPKGYQFYKTEDCDSCPICEAAKKPTSGWLLNIAAPARRALAQKEINNLNELSKFSESGIATLYGMGQMQLQN
jgi:NADH:ubiquinone oxidoreductase subunit F (NADH-binding)